MRHPLVSPVGVLVVEANKNRVFNTKRIVNEIVFGSAGDGDQAGGLPAAALGYICRVRQGVILVSLQQCIGNLLVEMTVLKLHVIDEARVDRLAGGVAGGLAGGLCTGDADWLGTGEAAWLETGNLGRFFVPHWLGTWAGRPGAESHRSPCRRTGGRAIGHQHHILYILLVLASRHHRLVQLSGGEVVARRCTEEVAEMLLAADPGKRSVPGGWRPHQPRSSSSSSSSTSTRSDSGKRQVQIE